MVDFFREALLEDAAQVAAHHGERRQRLTLSAKRLLAVVYGLLSVALASGDNAGGDLELRPGAWMRVPCRRTP